MNNQENLSIPPDLYNTINASLQKAEALAIIAASIDLEPYDMDIINHYLWTLSDIITHAKRLYQQIA